MSGPTKDVSRRRIIGILALSLLAVGVLWLVVSKSDDQVSPPELSSDLWHERQGEREQLLFLTREARVHRAFGRGAGPDQYYDRYRVVQLDAQNGDVGAKVEIGDRPGNTAGPAILGVANHLLWLWNEGFEVRSLPDLEVVVRDDELRAANPEIAASLPTDPSFYIATSTFSGMVVRTTDGRYWQLDPGSRATGDDSAADLRLRPLDDRLRALSSRGTIEHAVTYCLAPPNTRASSRDFQTNASVQVPEFARRGGDRVVSEWFGLLSDEERSSLARWSGEPRSVTGSPWRALYKGECWVAQDSTASAGFPRSDLELDLTSLDPLGPPAFLAGGFLVEPATRDAWVLDSPRSFLILSRPSLAKEATWSLSRVDPDGAVLWRTDTGIQWLKHVTDGGESVVLGGYPDVLNLSRASYEVVLIAKRDGYALVHTVQTGETEVR
ncbi:MAG: hypothetical protein KDA27_24575 [Candidatus Eisenbacteria bacterium]|uniref:Uncharacterized protein n=1 Tax=Eiseniibacteriota bacterium TaxID=2212470 RepID=A0A956SG49_UNCEI|nr:hypothetical protein [Candidatus Eisenbacteria bacterium]MCB9464784.1 hypothetical protein [Candidatus Eisenbacteria bacterium]